MKTRLLLFLLVFLSLSACVESTQTQQPDLYYEVSLDKANDQIFGMTFTVIGIQQDSVILKLPQWTPGYYQLMDFTSDLSNLKITDQTGLVMDATFMAPNAWMVTNTLNKDLIITYDIKADRKFVAQSFIDSTHAYLVPTNNFLYIDGYLNQPLTVEISGMEESGYSDIITGLEQLQPYTFTAPDFDILYDSPILAGPLERLPEFEVGGISHQFAGYLLGDFNREEFNKQLKKVVEAATTLMGDIPYNNYTFLAIGPGFGGIEHLNNTTISFDGNKLKSTGEIKDVMSFIAHEYFHHYNVKRIRPYELGPFNYDGINRTTQLWISEGLTVYYEYMLTRMADITSEEDLIRSFEHHINHVENNMGRFKQSLVQSSYNTWEDGPFGVEGKTISYYQKGPLVGLLLDLSIRQATQNQQSLDDVMRFLYQHYYLQKQRGFTDAEFQQACESIAGTLLTDVFDYVHTKQELDYNHYLHYAGLDLVKIMDRNTGQIQFRIEKLTVTNALQQDILKSWLRE
ncbi:M61 family metallopeptidase [Carboxylicivirga linearis]|uniref:M61 family metallopeptidase n=1 Tax=Carboxylicivirga linearis TaxID=1628157 RepID=A0ABS5JVJ9_9BACT|nr:M61 family metallopeptidase [Carboxylicivirga linearis]MBS2098351.1 M61 family metallopeptidase [Carboxylicivirga linearis]